MRGKKPFTTAIKAAELSAYSIDYANIFVSILPALRARLLSQWIISGSWRVHLYDETKYYTIPCVIPRVLNDLISLLAAAEVLSSSSPKLYNLLNKVYEY